MIAGWGDYPDAAEAVAIVLAIDPQASSRCARAHPVATALIRGHLPALVVAARRDAPRQPRRRSLRRRAVIRCLARAVTSR